MTREVTGLQPAAVANAAHSPKKWSRTPDLNGDPLHPKCSDLPISPMRDMKSLILKSCYYIYQPPISHQTKLESGRSTLLANNHILQQQFVQRDLLADIVLESLPAVLDSTLESLSFAEQRYLA